MNYAYDYTFDCSPSSLAETRIRYSAGECAELSEVTLSETQNPLSLETVRGYDADTLSCNALRVARSGDLLRIDWNRNGVYDPGPVQVDFSGATRSCGADGQFQSHQRDSNDFQTIAQSLAAAIRSPFTSSCAGVAADTGYLHAKDTPNFQPVCGLPPVRDLRENPWLKVNPVFRIRPGLLIEHPALRHQLAPLLTPDFRVRPEAPIQAAPLPTPDAFRAPPVRLEPAGPASERSLRGRLAPASR
jgi:hypothetical protein